jgi:hypothetical protein
MLVEPAGNYSLKDTPAFDDDVTILSSGNYSGQASGSMNIIGSTTLANNATIAAGATHIYLHVSFNVSLNLEPGSADGGDNIYTPCTVVGNGPGCQSRSGLVQQAELDRTGDGITDITDDACGDLPYIVMRKDLVNVTSRPDGKYTVAYNIIVENKGGVTGSYKLLDIPSFDDDATIVDWSYLFVDALAGISFAQAYPSAPAIPIDLSALGAGSITAGNTQTYTLSFTVKLDLEPGSTDGGDNEYTSCEVSGSENGSSPGQGLYNKAKLDRNNDGSFEIEDDACGDIPYVTMVKNLGTVTANANGTYNVTYQVIVKNIGGAAGSYSLKDTPQFDNDVTINNGNYSGQASGSMNTSGSTTLATNAGIAAGATHTYNVSFNVSLNLEPGSTDGGDNIYTACGVAGNGPGSQPGQGLYNKAELDRTGDGITDITDDACGDLPYVKMRKDLLDVIQLVDGSYRVVYKVIVENVGGADGSYTLTDSPAFDNDVTITAWDYTFVDVLAGFGNGPAFVGSPVVPINFGTKAITAGNTHIYTLGFNVTLDLEPGSVDGGDNIYTPCSVSGSNGGSTPGQGLYNKAEVDRTGDGITDITDEVPMATIV